jgi:hypothetical protein
MGWNNLPRQEHSCCCDGGILREVSEEGCTDAVGARCARQMSSRAAPPMANMLRIGSAGHVHCMPLGSITTMTGTPAATPAGVNDGRVVGNHYAATCCCTAQACGIHSQPLPHATPPCCTVRRCIWMASKQGPLLTVAAGDSADVRNAKCSRTTVWCQLLQQPVAANKNKVARCPPFTTFSGSKECEAMMVQRAANMLKSRCHTALPVATAGIITTHRVLGRGSQQGHASSTVHIAQRAPHALP